MKESCDIVAFASSSMWMTLSTNHESEFTYVVDWQLTILILSQNYVIILFQKEIDFRKEWQFNASPCYDPRCWRHQNKIVPTNYWAVRLGLANQWRFEQSVCCVENVEQIISLLMIINREWNGFVILYLDYSWFSNIKHCEYAIKVNFCNLHVQWTAQRAKLFELGFPKIFEISYINVHFVSKPTFAHCGLYWRTWCLAGKASHPRTKKTSRSRKYTPLLSSSVHRHAFHLFCQRKTAKNEVLEFILLPLYWFFLYL